MGIHRPFYMFESNESAPLFDIRRLPLEDKGITVVRHRRRIHAVFLLGGDRQRHAQATFFCTGPVPRVWVAWKIFYSVELV
jgi:hypothetical protein